MGSATVELYFTRLMEMPARVVAQMRRSPVWARVNDPPLRSKLVRMDASHPS
jgi:hypothetical protein